MQKTENFFKTIFVLFIGFCALFYSTPLKAAIEGGITVCLKTIIPSLYFFMIISTMLMQTGFRRFCSVVFTPLTKAVLGINGDIFAVFLLSQLGGYPIGIRLISKMYDEKQITLKQARLYSYFCFGSGPAFILGIVPLKEQFFPILISNILSNIILAFLLCRFKKNPYSSKPLLPQNNLKIDFVESVCSAAKSLFNVCIMIIAVRALLEIAVQIGIFDAICAISNKLNFPFDSDDIDTFCLSFFEISNITTISKTFLSAALLSFGGICVIMQVISLSSFKISLFKFCLSRAFCAAFSAIICSLIYSEPKSIDAISAMANVYRRISSVSMIESVLLLAMSCILLTKNSRQIKNNML